MKRVRLTFCLALWATLGAGCASAPQHSLPAAHDPYTQPRQPASATAGAIYQSGTGVALFEDVRARRVGDTVNVLLSEQTAASKTASTTTSKDNSVDVDNPTLFGSPFAFRSGSLSSGGLNLDNALESTKDFSGEGESEQSNELTGSVTATVVEVLPNGYLRIRGEKTIAINQGDEHIRLTGIVRPIDIRSDNTIPSTRVANARIAYGGSGVVANASDMGWLSKFFNSKWWPF